MKINLKTAGIGLLACVSLTSKGEKPNIIYILADDLGYAELGCYGQEKLKLQTSISWPKMESDSRNITLVLLCQRQLVAYSSLENTQVMHTSAEMMKCLNVEMYGATKPCWQILRWKVSVRCLPEPLLSLNCFKKLDTPLQ